MGNFKEFSIEVEELWTEMRGDSLTEIKKEFPHIAPEAASMISLERMLPRFVAGVTMLRLNTETEEPKETKEIKNVKRRKASKSDDKQLKFKIDGPT